MIDMAEVTVATRTHTLLTSVKLCSQCGRSGGNPFTWFAVCTRALQRDTGSQVKFSQHQAQLRAQTYRLDSLIIDRPSSDCRDTDPLRNFRASGGSLTFRPRFAAVKEGRGPAALFTPGIDPAGCSGAEKRETLTPLAGRESGALLFGPVATLPALLNLGAPDWGESWDTPGRPVFVSCCEAFEKPEVDGPFC
jgi:hypothetical protein